MSSASEIARAKALLERLRVRTVERGATPAEAAAAAELASRICRRYGLDMPTGESPGKHGQELETNVCPGWVQNLALAIATRFHCDGSYSRCYGARSAIVFEGEDHLASVAQWLFSAVYQDIVKRSHFAAMAHSQRGSSRVRFRNTFSDAAAWAVVLRLTPPRKRPAPEDRELSPDPRDEAKRKKQPRKVKPLTPGELLALMAGSKAGKELSIDTNAVGDRRGATLALTAG